MALYDQAVHFDGDLYRNVVSLRVSRNLADDLSDDPADAEVTHAGLGFIEVLPPGITKATGLAVADGRLSITNGADAINNTIRGRFPTTNDLNRRWVTANNGNIYQYLYFEPGRNRLNALSIYQFGKDPSKLVRRPAGRRRRSLRG